jgi:OOP family OmpA-OmpF porin
MHSIRIHAILVALLLLNSRANAQTSDGGVALNQFDPAPAGGRFFTVPSPYAQGHLVPRGIVVFDYAHQPLVVSDGVNMGAIVAAQGFLHIGGSLSLWDHLLVYADLPIALLQNGTSPTIGDVTFSSPQGVQLGDLRFGGRIRVAGENHEPFQLSVGTSIYFPTAPQPSFAGDGGFRLSPEIVAGGIFSRFVWGAVLRPVFRTSSNPATLNHGAGVGMVLANDRLQLSVEYIASTPLQEGLVTDSKGKNRIPRGLLSNVELHASVRGRIVSGLWAGIAAGPGLTDAIGTPQFRMMAMVGWLGAPVKDKH